MKTLLTLLALLLAAGETAFGQYSQTIRGQVIDKDSRQPLIGATVVLQTDPPRGTISDTAGYFRLEQVPVGRQSLEVRYLGYKTSGITDLVLNSAREAVITIEMESMVLRAEEVVVKGNQRKDLPSNRMAALSARSFTVDETERYAGSRGDVARMAMNYAGVAAANDQRNDIIIRGNSPSGLLWKLDEVEIPNPNHFAMEGTTGGPVSMLNNNLLQNSDFLTGAFPAEYGNALSGVFDLKMRNGNDEQHEFLFQSGFNGFELGAEGPLSRTNRSSYLLNYRYSTLQLMDKFMDIGTTGIPKYQDLSWKLNIPVKQGKIVFFGLTGGSEIAMLDSKNNEQDLYSDEGQDLVNGSETGIAGLSYTRSLGTKSYLKATVSTLYEKGWTSIDTLDSTLIPHPFLRAFTNDVRYSTTISLSTRISSQFSQKVGLQVDKLGYTLNFRQFEQDSGRMLEVIDQSEAAAAGPLMVKAYYQGVYRFNDQISIYPGVHMMHLTFNNRTVFDPRIALVWQPGNRQRLSLGYGLHSKSQALTTYFYGSRTNMGELVYSNQNLGFTRAHHLVAGYDFTISNTHRLKVEGYYQSLFDVPVEHVPGSFSTLNAGSTWGIVAVDSLQNKGTGKNMGMEFTLEKFFSKNYYYLLTLSLFNSKYTGSDGIERNTAFNGQYVLNALAGKEFQLGKGKVLFTDTKISWGGGKWYTPIDLEKSREHGYTVTQDENAYSNQFPDYFKWDIKIGLRTNGKRIAQEWQIYVENVTNHQNVLMQSYSRSKDAITTIYQLGVFPMVLYRLNF
ncbi:MAG: TonB-dependent receptor [Bacteroidales bacterium]